ncbi:hypothetical protein FNF31_07077 [Cafeteria roenbergensis]|uniref:Anoctamin transmembrane domain-containing protein n=1 Tax=Cafeteria roenbergensis TaxID=33653 RepID=A0A5A8CAH9_CAFRO|nr:hypothetical protein FNF31_07077 [Cafeteria roenbergensis]
MAGTKPPPPPRLPRELLAIPASGVPHPCRACLPQLLADIFFPLPLDPYAHIHAPLVTADCPSDPRNELYYTHKTTGSILGSGAALRMLLSILEGPSVDGGVGMGPLSRLISQGRISGWFPGRLEAKDAALARSWGAFAPLCCQPLDLLQSLFGSKAALYFAFIAFIASMLVVPAAVGAAAFVHQQLVETPSEVAWAPLFALVVIMVLGVATKMWNRRERELAMRWGLLNAHRSPQLRSEFKQPHRRHRSPVTGRPTYWQSATERASRTFCAASCTATAMGVVVVVTLSTFLVRVALAALERRGLIEPSWSGNASSVIGAVVVTVTQMLYSRMAVCLTHWEERPTDVEHDASLICKQGVFNAVNVSFALLWTAFAQTRASLIFSGQVEPCSPGPDGSDDCLAQLRAQVASLLLTKYIVDNAVGAIVPWLLEHWSHILCCQCRKCFPGCCWWCCCGCGGAPRHYVNTPAAPASVKGGTPVAKSGEQALEARSSSASKLRTRLSSGFDASEEGELGTLKMDSLRKAEADSRLPTFEAAPEMHQVLAVLTVAILFVVSLPLAPLVAIVYLATARLVDADKLIRATRRPRPEDVPSMGPWILLLDAITRAAVVVNAAVVFFTPGHTAVSGSSAGFPGLFGPVETREQRLIAFVAVEASVLGVLWLIGNVIPDQPDSVTLQASRQAYLVARHIHLHRTAGKSEQLGEMPGDDEASADAKETESGPAQAVLEAAARSARPHPAAATTAASAAPARDS